MFRNPTLTAEIVDDHRKPFARYGAMMSALRKRLAPAQLHHRVGHDLPTHSPMFYEHWQMGVGARRSLSSTYSERAVYVAVGEVDIDGTILRAGQMAVLDNGSAVDIAARSTSTVMVLGGEPLGQRFLLWNFVSSSKERLEQAAEDWRQQRMKLPVGDTLEFIPMPENGR
jgi:redox-sensitive bicupin YhaK (pirin superfamily)